MNDLKPDRCVHKALLSSRSRFVGEYDHPDEPGILVTHGWQVGPEMHRNLAESPFSQSFFVAAFRSTPVTSSRPVVALPEYSYFADYLAVHFSVLYGKHFQSHGLLESNGHFRVPAEIRTSPTTLFTLPPFNHAVRRCVPVPLNLCEISRIRPLFEDKVADSALGRMLFTAARFYSRALIDMESQPELSYVSLVTCGEVISNSRPVSDDDLYDDQLKQLLAMIKSELKDGSRVADTIQSRLHQIRRRFSTVLRSMLDDYFFGHHEAKEDAFALKKDTIDQCLKAAYDLRSLYVHTGIQFGGHAGALPNFQNEVAIGKPVLSNSDLVKALVKAPTLFGLERIMRYALLRVAAEAGATLDDLYQEKNAGASGAEHEG